MADQRTTSRTFDDFERGPWHALGPYDGPRKGFNYDSVNMQVYLDGTVGPRPWARAHYKVDLSASPFSMAFIAHKLFRAGIMCHQARETDLNAGYHTPLVLLFISDNTVGSPYAYTPFGVPTKGNVFIRLPFSTSGLVSGSVAGYLVSGASAVTPTLTTIFPTRLEVNNKRYGKVGQVIRNDVSTLAGTFGILNNIASGSMTLTDFLGGLPSADPDQIVKYRNRHWVWGDEADRSLIWYSGIENETFNAGDYLRVGPQRKTRIVGCYPLLNSMLICTNSHDWYLFTCNADPQQGTMKILGRYPIPLSGTFVGSMGDSIAYLTDMDRGVSVGSVEGIDTTTLKHIKPAGFSPYRTYTARLYTKRGASALHRNALTLPYYFTGGDTSEFEYVGGERALDFQDGVWSRHLMFNNPYASSFDTSINYDAVLDVDSISEQYFVYTVLAADDGLGLEDQRKYTIFTRDPCLNRPSRGDDVFSDKTEDVSHLQINGGSGTTLDSGGSAKTNVSSGYMELPIIRPENAEELRLNRVVLDLKYWKGSNYATPTMQVVSVLTSHQGRTIQNVGLDFSAYAGTMPDANGVLPLDRRVVLTADPVEFGSQLQILLTNIRGIAIKAVTVYYDERDAPVTVLA